MTSITFQRNLDNITDTVLFKESFHVFDKLFDLPHKNLFDLLLEFHSICPILNDGIIENDPHSIEHHIRLPYDKKINKKNYVDLSFIYQKTDDMPPLGNVEHVINNTIMTNKKLFSYHKTHEMLVIFYPTYEEDSNIVEFSYLFVRFDKSIVRKNICGWFNKQFDVIDVTAQYVERYRYQLP